MTQLTCALACALACAHAHETRIWASKSKGARHTFNYDLISSLDPTAQVSFRRIPTGPKAEKLRGYHPTQKPLRFVRRAVLASMVSMEEGNLVFDPYTDSGITAVAKEPNRAFIGAELEEELAKLAIRRMAATERGSLLREISEQPSEQPWSNA